MGAWWSTHGATIVLVLSILSFTPILMMENSIWWHWHIMMSDVELILSFILLTLMHIKSHCGDIILGNVHFVWSFFVLGWKLLTNMRSIQSLSVCSLILCERRASEICLIHLHWMLPILTHHIHCRASTTVIWCCSSIWHSTYKALTLQAHANCHISSHLVHLLKIDPVHGL